MCTDYEEEMRKIASQVVDDAKEEIEAMTYEVLEKYAMDYLRLRLKEIIKKEEEEKNK